MFSPPCSLVESNADVTTPGETHKKDPPRLIAGDPCLLAAVINHIDHWMRWSKKRTLTGAVSLTMQCFSIAEAILASAKITHCFFRGWYGSVRLPLISGLAAALVGCSSASQETPQTFQYADHGLYQGHYEQSSKVHSKRRVLHGRTIIAKKTKAAQHKNNNSTKIAESHVVPKMDASSFVRPDDKSNILTTTPTVPTKTEIPQSSQLHDEAKKTETPPSSVNDQANKMETPPSSVNDQANKMETPPSSSTIRQRRRRFRHPLRSTMRQRRPRFHHPLSSTMSL